MPEQPVVPIGAYHALYSATIIANTAISATPVFIGGGWTRATFVLIVSGKTMDAETTLNLYVQYSPNQGVSWDDLVAFAQITNAAIGNGTYVAQVVASSTTGAVDRAVTDKTLTANNIRQIPFGDRLRVVGTPANFAGTDTITISITVYLQP